tara:strand:+ start:165 stop:1328 length:1164 start_codon:yes stop_codon:yes gene_type:complete
MRFIDFYEKNKIIPVVDSRDIKKTIYENQRKNFYYLLKINLSNLKGKKVLELCPGTGANVKFLLNFGLKKITLVDFNKESIKSCKKKFLKKRNVRIKYQNIYKFFTKEKFDYIIIENVLSNLEDPYTILEKASKMLKKNGYLIFSFCDEFSLFSEKIRGYISKLIIINEEKKRKRLLTFSEKTKLLSKVFISHLKKLNTKTRTIDKWVQDNLLLTEWWSEKNYLPLHKVLNFFDKKKIKLNYWSSSPTFYQDYTWYKKKNLKIINREVSKFYKLEQLNFIDIRKKYMQKADLDKIKKNIKSVNKVLNRTQNEKNINYNTIREITIKVKKLIAILKKNDIKNPTAKSLISLNNFLNNISKKNNIKLKYLSDYKPFWGKGTMQVSFVKN